MQSVIHRRSLTTAPAAAAALRSGLRAGWPTADLLRVVREMKSDSTWVTTDAERAAFFEQPSTTGDQRWDAMLAGVVEGLALRGGFPPPAWTPGHVLPEFWFVGSTPSLAAYAFARSPFSLQIRGVMSTPPTWKRSSRTRGPGSAHAGCRVRDHRAGSGPRPGPAVLRTWRAAAEDPVPARGPPRRSRLSPSKARPAPVGQSR